MNFEIMELSFQESINLQITMETNTSSTWMYEIGKWYESSKN